MASFHQRPPHQIHHPYNPARIVLSPREPGPSPKIDKALSVTFSAVVLLGIGYVMVQSVRRCFNVHRNGLPPASNNRSITIDVIPDKSTAAQLDAIPVGIFGSASSPASSPPSSPPPSGGCGGGGGREEESCSVCLAEYAEGEEVRVLPGCGHMFHRDCIDRWLITRSSFCPMCRDRVIKRAVEPGGGNGNNLRLQVEVVVNLQAPPRGSTTVGRI